MSHTPSKKSVFDRIGGSGGNSSSNLGTTNTNTKSTHGFCNAFIKTGTCPLGDSCKYIHEQPNLDKQQAPKEELRITKTTTRVVDMSSSPIKSTVTVSNEQRPTVTSNPIQSSRTVVASIAGSIDHSDRRSSGSDRKQSQNRNFDSKSQSTSSSSSSKKKTHSSSYENRYSSNKKNRSNESDSPASSASDSEYTHSPHKRKKRSDNHSTSSKHKKHDSVSPNHDDDGTLHDQLIRQTQSYNKSPKRTIVITERKKDDNIKRLNKDSKTKSNPDIEFLGSKKINRDKKSIETIHQQAESNKKSSEIKREKKSPNKSSSDQQRHHSSSTNTSNTSINEKTTQIKIEDTKQQSNKIQNSSERYERSDRNTQQSTPLVVQLSPTPPIPTTSEISEKEPVVSSNETEKPTSVQPPSPICVILDDDSSPAPSIDKKLVRQTPTTPVKKTNENDKNNSKQSKRFRDSDKSHNREKTNENSETKRKRLNDGSSRKITSSSKNTNDNRSTSNRSDSRRNPNTSSKDESSNRKYKEKSESKISRSNNSKERTSTIPSSKSHRNNDRRDTTRSSPEKKRLIHRRGKERGLENVTDSEEHFDEPILPKPSVIEAYMSMDWSLLSRDKRIPLNTQVTSRIARIDNSNNSICVSERLLTNEQKDKLNGIEFQSLPLTNFMKQLQTKTSSQIINSCNRRFGSCAKDIIEMRHKWFTRSTEPVQQYEFINKEHYIAYHQAINSLLNKTSNDIPTVQIETTTADILLS